MNLEAGLSSPSESTPTPPVPDEEPRYRFSLTPMAVRNLYQSLRKRGTPDAALRVGVRGGGCSGFTYVLEFTDRPPGKRDLVFPFTVEQSPDDEAPPGEVRVFCDKKSIIYLNGSALDWEKTLMHQGFKFVNPKETSTCGCNTSFAV